VGERIVAAGMTLLVAGGMTVGAATLVNKKDADQGRDDRVAAAAAPEVVPNAPEAQPPARETVVPERPDRNVDRAREDRPEQAVDEEELPPVVDEPVTEPPTDPGGVPIPPVDGEEPDPGPTDGPPTGPPPAPAWSFTFQSSMESVETCACPESRVTTAPVSAEDGVFAFSTVITGGAVDAVGDPTWPFHLIQNGAVQADGGELLLRFGLTSVVGHLYEGTADLVDTIEHEGGSTTYRFEGSYALITPDVPLAGLPWRGTVTATIGVWADGTIFTGSLALQELVA
jgi:hypothetical protein